MGGWEVEGGRVDAVVLEMCDHGPLVSRLPIAPRVGCLGGVRTWLSFAHLANSFTAGVSRHAIAIVRPRQKITAAHATPSTLPQLNLFSKCDVLDQHGELDMPLDFYLEAHGLDRLTDFMNEGLPERFHDLTQGLCEVRIQWVWVLEG